MRRTSLKWGAGTAFAGAAVLAVSALTLSSSAYSQQPNVGTVKIDDVDLGSVPNNEPHVDDCEFEVEFFGYPANQSVTATIIHVPPTGDGEEISDTTTLDDDDESGGGSAEGFDGSLTFDATDLVAGTEPQPNQGWHLRLEVEDGGVGGTKNKEFWVEGCAPGQPTTTSTTTTSTTTSTTSTTTTTRPTTTTTTAPSGPTTTAAPGAPARPSGAAVPPARPPTAGAVTPGELAVTGTNSSLALVGVALVLVGAGLSLAVRRRPAA